jgi:membrane associated rhomboid family serine protease
MLIKVPAWLFIVLWGFFQVFWAILSPSTSTIAWFAHLGGFICGIVLTLVFQTLKRQARDRVQSHVPYLFKN